MHSSTFYPPAIGPTTWSTTPTIAKGANGMARVSGGNGSAIMACSPGARPPPPIPWSTRAITSVVRLGAIPHRKEASVNSAMEIRK